MQLYGCDRLKSWQIGSSISSHPHTHMGCDQKRERTKRKGFSFNPRTHVGCDRRIQQKAEYHTAKIQFLREIEKLYVLKVNKALKLYNLLIMKGCETNGVLCNSISSHPLVLNDKFACKINAKILSYNFNFVFPIAA